MSASASTAGNANIIGGDAKRAKFDRQLRLWGADGQAALEAAHVVALGATPAVSEALKSLVLTGVSAVTLVDERDASPDDAASNYFVSSVAPHRSLAACVLEHVCALGEQCYGVAACVSPDAWATGYTAAVDEDYSAGRLSAALHTAEADDNDGQSATAADGNRTTASVSEAAVDDGKCGSSAVDAFMRRFPITAASANAAPLRDGASYIRAAPTLVLVSERYADLSATSPLVQTLQRRCFPDVPVMLVRSSGLLGFVHIYNPSRVITRPHNPTQVKMEDLRIFSPFPALQRWFDAHDPDDNSQFSVDDADSMSLHSHLPYPCILHHAYRRWWAALSPAEQRARLRPCAAAADGAASASQTVFPLSALDYRAIASVVAGMIRRQSPPEDAFVEAMEKCTAKLNRPVVPQLPDGLRRLFDDARCADPVTAVAELATRLPSALATAEQSASVGGSTVGSPALPAMLRQRLLWTSTDALVWFVLAAVRRFVFGAIGRDEVGPSPSPLSPLPPQQPQQHVDSKGDASALEKESGEPALPLPLPVDLSPYHMPFSGHVPDFTTTTMWYRELQDIYHAKHSADVACIAKEALKLVAEAMDTQERGNGCEAAAAVKKTLLTDVESLVQKLTATVVENIWDLRIVSFSAAYRCDDAAEWPACLGRRLTHFTRQLSYDMTWNAGTRRAACLAVAALTLEELRRQTAALTASNTDTTVEARVFTGEEIAAEAERLVTCTGEGAPLVPDWFVEEAVQGRLFLKACEEVSRWSCAQGGGVSVQMPSIAASTGALAAQEAVKLLMRIRVSCGDPIMYDGYANKVYTL